MGICLGIRQHVGSIHPLYVPGQGNRTRIWYDCCGHTTITQQGAHAPSSGSSEDHDPATGLPFPCPLSQSTIPFPSFLCRTTDAAGMAKGRGGRGLKTLGAKEGSSSCSALGRWSPFPPDPRYRLEGVEGSPMKSVWGFWGGSSESGSGARDQRQRYPAQRTPVTVCPAGGSCEGSVDPGQESELACEGIGHHGLGRAAGPDAGRCCVNVHLSVSLCVGEKKKEGTGPWGFVLACLRMCGIVCL
jgi:hypothetical protein